MWAVKHVEFAAAAILGLLDFLDRRHERPGELLAPRQRIVSDLQGIVGRNSIDAALSKLVQLQWIKQHEITATTGNNIATTHWYSLCPETIAQHLRGHGIAGVPKSGCRSSPPGAPDRESHLLQEEDGSSASLGDKKTKMWTVRPSGIETWTPNDQILAERLETETAADDLAVAITSLRDAKKAPYPSLVAREIKKQQGRRDSAARTREREAAAEAAADKRLQHYLARQRRN